MTIAQQLRRVGGTVFLALLLALTAGSVAALHHPELHEFVISAVNCDDYPVTDESQCEPAVGTQFTVTTEDGEALGSCTTELLDPDSISARCSVSVPYGITVLVTEDTASISSDLAPVENPQSVDTPPNLAGGGEPPDIAFVNVLQGDDAEDDTGGDGVADDATTDDATGGTTELPDTGIGTTAVSPDVGTLALVSAMAAVLMLLAGLFLRRSHGVRM